MPKRYEDEINEILGKYDWPSDNRARRPREESPARHASPLSGFDQLFAHFGAPQIMLVGLVLVLLGAVLHFGGQLGVNASVGTYATIVGFLLLLGGYVLAVARGGSSARGGPALGSRQQFWRGQVVDLRPSNRGPAYWWWRLRTNLRRR